jgi:hypothetical protein
VSFDDGNYNALGLQTPCVLEWNEDFFAGNSSAISGAKIPPALSSTARISVLSPPILASTINSSAQEERLNPLQLLGLSGCRSGTN